ncbi:hypothetical protein HMPREF0973_02790 [Prevotella veroralis F0319]|uniref:Uncharacterized protein n=1 Tax=Prevotella veroralis F0319 TaxID=649761 RepID=C9MT21_9BACT|nr:hypothetical protein HMPREF0973_02790 [Prevotella veroralis F0319]
MLRKAHLFIFVALSDELKRCREFYLCGQTRASVPTLREIVSFFNL